MLAAIALILLDAIVLQPIRCIVGFINRFLWYPVKYNTDRIIYPDYDLEKIKNDSLESYNWDSLLHSNDCCKFIGLFLSNKKSDDLLNYVRNLLDIDKMTIRRQIYDYDLTVDFSTDMMPGLMLILMHYPDLWTNKDTKEILQKITFDKIPFDFPDGYGNKTLKRGWFFNPFVIWASHNILTVLAWLSLCKYLTKDYRYTVLYYLLLICELPSILMACPIGNILLSKFKITGVAWHQIHSKMIVYCVGYYLTHNIIFKLAAKKIYKLHREFNPEIVGLYYKYILQSKIDKSSEDWYNSIHAVLACNEKGSLDSSKMNTVEYFDIRKFEKTNLLEEMHSCLYRNEEYQWERNPQKKQTMLSSKYRKEHRLDVFNALSLLDQ